MKKPGRDLKACATKEYGLDRHLMNSLALFVYFKDYSPMPDPVAIFNDWAAACGWKTDDPETIAGVVEHIRKLSQVDHGRLREALELDSLIIKGGI